MVHVVCILKKYTHHLGGENLNERKGTEDLGIDVSIILKWILQKDHAGLIEVRIRTSDGCLCTC